MDGPDAADLVAVLLLLTLDGLLSKVPLLILQTILLRTLYPPKPAAACVGRVLAPVWRVGVEFGCTASMAVSR